MKIKLNIANRKFTTKPTSYDIPGIRKDIVAHQKYIELSQLPECISQGRTFTPYLTKGTSGEGWINQQLFCVDIDNDKKVILPNGEKAKAVLDNPLKPEEVIPLLAEYNLRPFFIYYSFSNKPGWPKYRVIFATDEPVTVPAQAEKFTLRLIGLFNHFRNGCADISTRDQARLFFGSKADCTYFLDTDSVNSLADIESVPCFTYDSDGRSVPRTRASIGRPVKTGRPPGQDRDKSAYYPSGNPNHLHPKSEKGFRSLEILNQIYNFDKDHFDIEQYVIDKYGGEVNIIGNTRYINPCPICGHYDDFHVDGHIFYPFCGTGDNKGGTIIDFLMQKESMTVGEAKDEFQFNIMGYDRKEWEDAEYGAFKSRQKKQNAGKRTKMSELAYESRKPHKDWEDLPFLEFKDIAGSKAGMGKKGLATGADIKTGNIDKKISSEPDAGNAGKGILV